MIHLFEWIDWKVVFPVFATISLFGLKRFLRLRKRNRIDMSFLTIGNSDDGKDRYIQITLKTAAHGISIRRITCSTAALARYTQYCGTENIRVVPMYPWRLSYAFSFDPGISLKAGEPYTFFLSVRTLTGTHGRQAIFLKPSSIFSNRLKINIAAWKEIPQNKAPRPDNTDVGFQTAYDEMPPPQKKQEIILVKTPAAAQTPKPTNIRNPACLHPHHRQHPIHPAFHSHSYLFTKKTKTNHDINTCLPLASCTKISYKSLVFSLETVTITGKS